MEERRSRVSLALGMQAILWKHVRVCVLEIWREGEPTDELNLRTNLEAKRRHWGPDWLEDDGSFLWMLVCSFLPRGVCWLLQAARCVTESGLMCSGVQEGVR